MSISRSSPPNGGAWLGTSSNLGLDSKYVREGIAAYDPLWTDMEVALAEAPWLGGDGFSLADVGVGPWALRMGKEFGFAQFFWADRPRVADWFQRVSWRSAFQRAIDRPKAQEWIAAYQGYGAEGYGAIERILGEVRADPAVAL